jgi:hypothetical protein
LAIKDPLSRNISLSSEISAVTEPFTNFFFSRLNFGCHGAFVELFFSRWNFGYHKAFLELFFSLWNFGYHGAFLKLLFFYDKISAITEPFSNFFFPRWNFRRHALWGKTLFIYITDSIYIGFASLKTLPLDLGPLCKEKSMVLLILN